MGYTLFISDVHLDPDDQTSQEALTRFLRTQAIKADALYVLGDLFDYWLDDDQVDGLSPDLIDSFQMLSVHQVPVFFMHGNHDFLIGKRFLDKMSMTFLPDPSVVTLYGKKLLLSHGDLFCSEDRRYQQMRSCFRHALFVRVAHSLPLGIKRFFLRFIQYISKSDKQRKTSNSMDVSQPFLSSLLSDYGVDSVIHGHTHQPKHHIKSAKQAYDRLVLGSWDKDFPVLYFNDQKTFGFMALDFSCVDANITLK
jgi:UDP-2,3-diacylglucosamine hydrolase